MLLVSGSRSNAILVLSNRPAGRCEEHKVISIIVNVLSFVILSPRYTRVFVGVVVAASLLVWSPLCKLDKLFELMYRY